MSRSYAWKEETVLQKRDVFGILPTDWFREEYVTSSSARHMEPRTCLYFSCNDFGIDNERPG